MCSTSTEICGYWSRPDTFSGLGALEGGNVGFKRFFKMNNDLWIEALWAGAL